MYELVAERLARFSETYARDSNAFCFVGGNSSNLFDGVYVGGNPNAYSKLAVVFERLHETKKRLQ